MNNLAAMTAKELGGMSRAARAFASDRFPPRPAALRLAHAIQEAGRAKIKERQAWNSRSPGARAFGHVLVISDCGDNLLELRVSIPFTALHGRGLIAGYSIWRNGKFAFSTSPEQKDIAFDAIWVQREIVPISMVALITLSRPFVYDIDDNLLVSPVYRRAFSMEHMQSVRYLLQHCAMLSCSTVRLGQELQRAAMVPLVDKAIVTPNLSRGGAHARPVGPPGSVICVVSDSLPLTDSARVVILAIRDFCLNHGLRIVWIGMPPPDLLIEAAVSVQHVGTVSYSAYLPLLQSFAPAIMACPMETNGDQATQRFINGKSDIKLLEALSSGLVGVFSNASPYLESDLPGALLTENSYAAWYEALTRARELCQLGGMPVEIPDERRASGLGLRPWFDALTRARLDTPLPASAFRDAIRTMRSRHGRRQLTEIEFDKAFYIESNADVRAALDRGDVQSAYDHYVSFGFSEGRHGHPGEADDAHPGDIWANLMKTMGDIRTVIEIRQQATERLKARRAARISLRRQNL